MIGLHYFICPFNFVANHAKSVLLALPNNGRTRLKVLKERTQALFLVLNWMNKISFSISKCIFSIFFYVDKIYEVQTLALRITLKTFTAKINIICRKFKQLFWFYLKFWSIYRVEILNIAELFGKPPKLKMSQINSGKSLWFSCPPPKNKNNVV